MNLTANDDDIDASLRRLSAWQPPEDFARRLSARAASQHAAASGARSRLQATGTALDILDYIALVTGYLYVAALVVTPWTAVDLDTPDFAWASVTALLTVAAWFTNRSLQKQ